MIRADLLAGGNLDIGDAETLLFSRRYFDLGREVKALGRGHIQRIKEDVRSSKESSERETAVPV